MAVITGSATVPSSATVPVFTLPPGLANITVYQPAQAQQVFLGLSKLTSYPLVPLTRGGLSTLASSASVANNGTIATGWATTQPVAGGKVLVYTQFPGPAAQLTVTDNGVTPATFSLATGTNATSQGAWVFYGDNITLPSAGNYTVSTVQKSGGAVTMSTFGIAYTGVNAGPPFLSAVNGATSASVTTGAIVPSQVPVLFFAGFTDSAGSETITLTNAHFTAHANLANGTYANLAVADAIETGQSEAATWTATGAAAYDSVIAAWTTPVPSGMVVNNTPVSAETYVGSAGATIYATTGNATASSFSYVISTAQ
jgi:hypothetical protein